MSINPYKFDNKSFRTDFAKASINNERNAMYLMLWATMGTLLNYRKSVLARECIRATWSITGRKE
jgi:hypothetical protein